MKTLCVLTNMFPYGQGEAYLESEVDHYNIFDKVFVFALMIKPQESKTRRELPDRITVIPVKFAHRLVYAIWSVAALSDKNLYKEIQSLIKKRSINLSKLIRMLVYFTRAHYEAGRIYKNVKNELEGQDVLFYSYRFEYQPYVAVLLKRKLKLKDARIVSRAHGYDLYEERNKDNYIPYRRGLLSELDYVFPCSNYGTRYLIDKYPEFENKVRTKYLGTKDHGMEECQTSDIFTVVSCSNVVKVKRLDKVVETLKLLNIERVKWVHYGDGPEMPWLKKAVSDLPDSVHVDLRGAVKNENVLDDYKHSHYDLFINLSDSEGLPVSIMEAMSFGIPCIATNVGGTSELVKDEYNGLLVDVNDKPDQIACRISDYIKDLKELGKNARDSWKKSFDEKTNYTLFVKELWRLLDI